MHDQITSRFFHIHFATWIRYYINVIQRKLPIKHCHNFVKSYPIIIKKKNGINYYNGVTKNVVQHTHICLNKSNDTHGSIHIFQVK
jgi:hypothetical protein